MHEPNSTLCALQNTNPHTLNTRVDPWVPYTLREYASTIHHTQGLTVDTTHALVDSSTDRRGLYITVTRGRKENHIWTITDPVFDHAEEAAHLHMNGDYAQLVVDDQPEDALPAGIADSLTGTERERLRRHAARIGRQGVDLRNYFSSLSDIRGDERNITDVLCARMSRIAENTSAANRSIHSVPLTRETDVELLRFAQHLSQRVANDEQSITVTRSLNNSQAQDTEEEKSGKSYWAQRLRNQVKKEGLLTSAQQLRDNASSQTTENPFWFSASSQEDEA